MNKEGVKVSYAAFHGPLFVPNLGDLGRTLTTTNVGKLRDLKMTMYDTVLSVQTQGFTVLVPLSMVTHVVAI